MEDLASAEGESTGEASVQLARARRTLGVMRSRMDRFRTMLANLGGYPVRLTAEDIPVGTRVYITDHVDRPRYWTRRQGEWTDGAMVRYAVVTRVEDEGVWLQNDLGEHLWRPFGRVIISPLVEPE